MKPVKCARNKSNTRVRTRLWALVKIRPGAESSRDIGQETTGVEAGDVKPGGVVRDAAEFAEVPWGMAGTLWGGDGRGGVLGNGWVIFCEQTNG
jgi:hypothetical protein